MIMTKNWRYNFSQVLWKHLGPMFLFGRVGDYDTWPGDWEKCQDITNVMRSGSVVDVHLTKNQIVEIRKTPIKKNRIRREVTQGKEKF